MTDVIHIYEPTRLMQSECSEIASLSQTIRCWRRLARMLDTTAGTLDKIVCGRRRAQARTIAKVRAALARLRVVTLPGVH